MPSNDTGDAKRDAMPFPFRWRDTLLALDDADLLAMVSADKIERWGLGGHTPPTPWGAGWTGPSPLGARTEVGSVRHARKINC